MLDTFEGQGHLTAMAYLLALKRGYRQMGDGVAEDNIDRALFHLNKSVDRAFPPKLAESLRTKAREAADKAEIGTVG